MTTETPLHSALVPLPMRRATADKPYTDEEYLQFYRLLRAVRVAEILRVYTADEITGFRSQDDRDALIQRLRAADIRHHQSLSKSR